MGGRKRGLWDDACTIFRPTISAFSKLRGVLDDLLPPRLAEILDGLPDADFAARLRAVHEAAARAIGRLGDLDLGRYEDSPLDGPSDLSLWEEVAPHLGATVGDVNGLLAELAVQFPPDQMYSDRRQGEIDSMAQALGDQLKMDVQSFGQRMRDPHVVSDRWNLLAELQAFRFKFREHIGSMVYDTASVLADCHRSEVEPGYQEDLKSALAVRSTTSDLRRLMRARLNQLNEAEMEDVEWNAQQLEKELDMFGRTPAWRALRAQDKKRALEFRQDLRGLPVGSMRKSDLVGILAPFVDFVESFDQVNKRDMLLQHDREVVAAIGVALEQALTVASSDSTEAQRLFLDALKQGQGLYGRSGELDGFLRRMRKTPPAPEALETSVEQFIALVAGLSLF